MENCFSKWTKKQTHICFCILFVAALALSLWKIGYGFGWYDEAFYATIPHRMLQGDAFIADEWHPSQLFGFLTLPFVAVYRLIRGNTDGILLYMRYVYLAWHFLIGCFLYKRLSKERGPVAALCVFSFLVFTPFDIMAPGYNAIGVDALSLVAVGLATEPENGPGLPCALYGLFYAAAVLCCPYLAILLPALLLATLLGRKRQRPLITGKQFLWFSAGILVLFAAFVAFESTRTTVGEFFRNFPQLFRDAEHTGETVFGKLKAYFNHAPHHFGVCLILCGLTLAGLAADRNRRKHASFWVVLSCLCALWGYAWSYADLNQYHNALMMPLFFPGLTAYILTEDRPKHAFVFITVTGLIYSLCLCFASNVGFHAVSLGYCVANIGSWLYIGRLMPTLPTLPEDGAGERGRPGRLARYAPVLGLAAVMACLLVLQVMTKVTHVFYDGSPSELTATIGEGPAAGIRTTPAKAGEYNRFLKDIRSFTAGHEGENLLVLSEKTWCYLMVDGMRYATYSAWLSGVNEASVARLQAYYDAHPDAEPDLIYVDRSAGLSEERLQSFAAENGYDIEKNVVAYWLTKR